MAKRTTKGQAKRALHHITKTGKVAVKKVNKTVKQTVVTLGDLINAAYEVGGDSDAAALLLANPMLERLIGRRIVLA